MLDTETVFIDDRFIIVYSSPKQAVLNQLNKTKAGFLVICYPHIILLIRKQYLMVETERLILRKFTENDLNDFYWVRSDPDVMKTLPGVQPCTVEETLFIINRDLQRWDNQGFGLWAVIFKEDQKLIGYCGLKYLEETSDVEIIYAVTKPYWGKGLTTESALASLKFGFENSNLKEIVAIALPDNLASRRVMEKIGMHFVAQTHNFGVDCVRYSITAEDFQKV